MSMQGLHLDIQSQISHELRIPLSAILGLVDFLQDTKLTQEQAMLVGDIQISANRLLQAQTKIKQLVNQYSK